MATTGEADLDAAYARLLEVGIDPTVRSLRDEARVSRDRAAAYLRQQTNDHQELPLPAEQLAGVLGPLWSMAVGKARQGLTEEHQGQRAAAADSEATALARVEELEAELTSTTSEAEHLAAELEALKARVDQLEATVETERAQARTAEARAARAEGEADTLRAVVGLREATSKRSSATTKRSSG